MLLDLSFLVNQIGREDHDDDDDHAVPNRELQGLQHLKEESAEDRPKGRQRRLRDLDPEAEDILKCHLRCPPDGCTGWIFFAEKEKFVPIKITDMKKNSKNPAEEILEFLYAKYPELTVLEFCQQLRARNCNGKKIAEFLKNHIYLP